MGNLSDPLHKDMDTWELKTWEARRLPETLAFIKFHGILHHVEIPLLDSQTPFQWINPRLYMLRFIYSVHEYHSTNIH